LGGGSRIGWETLISSIAALLTTAVGNWPMMIAPPRVDGGLLFITLGFDINNVVGH